MLFIIEIDIYNQINHFIIGVYSSTGKKLGH